MSIRVNGIEGRVSNDLLLGLFFFDSTKNRADDFFHQPFLLSHFIDPILL